MLLPLLVASTVGPSLSGGSAYRTVNAAWDNVAKVCSARIATVETGDVDSDVGKAALYRALPDRDQVVQIMGTDAVPYPCVRTIIAALRSGGYSRIGFNAEPTSASAR